MDLLQSSIGHSKYQNRVKRSRELPLKSAQQRSLPANKAQNPQIKKCIKRLGEQKLFGHPHVKRYLYDQYRRGCRPNTIRANFDSIILFIIHLKRLGRTYLEAVTRDDLSSFIEYEQDRELKPNTVSTRLRSLYAFLGYLAEREIVQPDVVTKKANF